MTYRASVEDTLKNGAPSERQRGRPDKRDATQRDEPAGIRAPANSLVYGQLLDT
jgi:hypothetical protein